MKIRSKIINDPVHGLIHIPHGIIMDVIEHPYFQRLRRIKQLGMADLVYPGSCHSRFHHAIGAYQLMINTLEVLKNKNVDITKEEEEAVKLAILFHDIGHGPFSHALEAVLLPCSHETISKLIIERFQEQFKEKSIAMALDIFLGSYSKHFLCQLVSSQLDVDRLDYLSRDAFFTGVSEGTIGFDRIIALMFVVDNKIVVEEKGLYSVEKFLIARRLMYWQVYFHKTVVSSEQILYKILKRAKSLAKVRKDLYASPALYPFLYQEIDLNQLTTDAQYIDLYCHLDDSDIWSSIKEWCKDGDPILSLLSQSFVDRKLYKLALTGDIPNIEKKANQWLKKHYKSNEHFHLKDYLFFEIVIEDKSYQKDQWGIKVMSKKNKILDLVQATESKALGKYLSTKVKKSFYFYLPVT